MSSTSLDYNITVLERPAEKFRSEQMDDFDPYDGCLKLERNLPKGMVIQKGVYNGHMRRKIYDAWPEDPCDVIHLPN